MSKDPQARGVARNVWAAGVVSLFTDISSEMLVPVIPLFLANVLGASAFNIGLIEGMAEFTASLMKAFSGWVSDRIGLRKPLMILGYGLSNILKPLTGFTATWTQVLGLRLADRFGKGVRGAPRDALIADSAPPATRGRAFGLHRTMDTIGAAIGPLMAGYILWKWPSHYRSVFWWAAVPGLLALVALLFVRETGKGRLQTGSGPVLRGWNLGLFSLSPRLQRFIVVSGLFALGNSADAFLVMRAQNLGLSVFLVPFAYFAFNLSYAILSYPVGALSDKIGRKPVMVAGWVVFAVIYFGFGWAHQAWMAWPLFLAYGLYYAGTEGIQKAYITDHAGAEQRGTAIGVYNAVTGVAALPASMIAGLLWSRVSPAVPFYVGSATAAASAFLLWIWA